MAPATLIRGTITEHSGTNILLEGATASTFAALSALVDTLVSYNRPAWTSYHTTEEQKYVSVTLDLEWHDKVLTLHLSHKSTDVIDVAESVLMMLKGQMLTGGMTVREVQDFLKKYDLEGHSLDD